MIQKKASSFWPGANKWISTTNTNIIQINKREKKKKSKKKGKMQNQENNNR